MNVSEPRQWRIAALVLLCGAGGCTMVPRYERPAAPVAAQFPGASATSTGNPAADLARNDFVKEERLRQLIALALANNRDLRVAALNVEQSRAQYRITRSASYPGIDAAGGLSNQHASGVATAQWSANVGIIAYELDLFGRAV